MGGHDTSVADLLGVKFIDAAGLIIPLILMYWVGAHGDFHDHLSDASPPWLRDYAQEPRLTWLTFVTLAALAVGAFYASYVLLGSPLT